jgi:hypothetical protein
VVYEDTGSGGLRYCDPGEKNSGRGKNAGKVTVKFIVGEGKAQ